MTMPIPPSPHLLNPADWPTVLAIPLRDYLQEQHPAMKLWGLCDLVELILRLAAVTGVAEMREQGGGLPAELRNGLWKLIQRPTSGEWKGIVKQILLYLPVTSLFRADLQAVFEDPTHGLFGLLDGPAESRSVENSLSKLRNEGLAHGAGVNKQLAARWLAIWQPRCEDALRYSSEILIGWRLVCLAPPGLAELRGPEVTPRPVDLPEVTAARVRAEIAAAEDDAVVLVRGEIVRRLWPLTLFGPPRSGSGDEDSESVAAPQLYGRNDVVLEYTPIGSEHLSRSIGSSAAREQFARLFEPPPSPLKCEVRGFEQDLRQNAVALVGRKEELQHIHQLLAGRDQGVLWLTGRPGIGKSFLLARVAVDLLSESGIAEARDQSAASQNKLLVLAYRFKIGDDRCERELFCQFALERLRQWPGLRAPSDPREDSEEARRHKAASLQLRETLARVNHVEGWRVLLLVDGLDELLEREQPKHASDPQSVAGFVRELPIACGRIPGVVWLCAGRPESALMRAFADSVCTPVFSVNPGESEGGGVPPMDAADIRQMLLNELEGPARRRLLEKDRESPDSQQVTNSFIARVAAHSQGVPLYVRLVLGEVKARGTLRHFDPSDLPKTLEEFYTRLIRRSTVGVFQQISTPVVALLALAREPLDQDTLLVLLRDRNLLDPTPSDDQARRQREYVMQALAVIAPLLRVLSTPDNKTGYTLTHHTLREFITNHEKCREMEEPVATASKSLLDSCAKPALLGTTARGYLVRHSASHLLSAKRWNDLYALLTGIFFLEAKNGAGLVFDLGADYAAAVAAWPTDTPEHGEQRQILKLLREALLRDIHFIHRHREDYPQGLFQCLWNSGWWYDCPSAATHYLNGQPGSIPHWQHSGPQLHRLLEAWQAARRDRLGDFPWLRTLRPPTVHLGTAQLAVLRGHEGDVSSVSFSPDGARIVSGSMDCTVRVWDAASGRELAVLRGHESGVESVSFSPDGARIVSGSEDKTVRMWDAASGRELAVLHGHESGVESVSFSPDGERIVSGSMDCTVRVWDAASGRELAVLRGHDGGVESVCFSPDGARIVSGSLYDGVRIWDAASSRELAVLGGHEGHGLSASFFPDGARIVSGSSDRTVRVWEAASGRELAVLRGHEHWVNSVIVSPDGARIVSGSWDRTVRVWDAASGRELAVLRGHESGVKSVSFSPDAARIVSGSSDGTVRMWDTASGHELAAVRGHEDGVYSLSFSPDGRRIVSGSYDGTVRVWDTASGRELVALRGDEYEGYVRIASYSPNGARIVSGSMDGTVRVWDAASGRELAILRGHVGPVNSVTYSHDGARIVSGSHDETVRIWDAVSGHELAVLRGHESGVESVSFSPDNARIVSGSADHTVRVWDAASGRELAILHGHVGQVNSVAYSHDGAWIVSGSHTKTVRLWNATHVMESDDDSVRVWDSATYENVKVARGYDDVTVIARGDQRPYRALTLGHETVIERADTRRPVAWFTEKIDTITLHPSSLAWAGCMTNHLQIIQLEGMG